MTESSLPPETAAAPEAEDGKPRSFMVWTGKRHVFRVKAPEYYWLVTQVKLLGDVPAIEHEVKIIDPDTGEVVGDPVTTDDQGVLRAEVPSNKAYHLQLVDSEPEAESIAPPEIHIDDHAVLRCQFVHASGEPLADAEIHAKLGETEMVLTTDEAGRIEGPAQLGYYELSYGEEVFHAHSLPEADAAEDEAVYHFVVEGGAAAEGEGEPAGESGESPEDQLWHHDMGESVPGEEEPA